MLARSVLSAEGLGLALLVAAAATAVLVGAVAARAARPGFGFLDAAAIAAVGLVALELARGEGDGDLTLLLPALVTFAAAVLVARLLRPALRGVERLARRRSLGLRLASLSLARNPGYAVVATSFLVVSFGLALFAESYRATLARGERDQAAHRVPLDYVVREDLRRLIPFRTRRRFERFRDPWRRRGAGAAADRRRCVGSGGREWDHAARDPARGAGAAHGWRDSDASASRSELARRIEVAVHTRRVAAVGAADGPARRRHRAATSGSSPRSRGSAAASSGFRSAGRSQPKRAAAGWRASCSSLRRVCRNGGRMPARR